MKILKISVGLVVLLIIAACKVGPTYNRPVIFENEVLEKTLDLKTPSVTKLPFQPQDFQDKLLNELIKEALEKAPDVRTARANIKAARAVRLAAVSGLFPTFDSSGQYSYEKMNENMEMATSENLYQAGLVIGWEIDVFGKKQYEIEAASAAEEQAKLGLENVAVSLISEVGSAYVGLRTTQYLLEQTKEDLKIQQALSQLTHEKYKTGLSSAIDVNQADYQLSTTKAAIPRLETEIETYENTLAVLIGQPAGGMKERLKNSKDNLIIQPMKSSLKNFFEVPVEVLRLRPDVLGLELALKKQNAELGKAIASLFPSVSLSAFFGFRSIHFNNIFEKESYSYSYQPSINAPLFHFGALWQNVKLQEAYMENMMVQYEQALLNATKEVRNVLVGLQKMEARHKDLETAWKKMDRAAKLARNRYESGLIDYFQVLDAEERRISAQTALTTSSGALYQNMLNFYKAIGGHFSFDQLQKIKSEK